MGNRHDDITGQQRAQIALACWRAGNHHDGTQKRLAQEHHLSRQSVYNITCKAERYLPAALEPGRHGPTPWAQTVEVTRAHVVRSVLALFRGGMSERDMPECLQQILGVDPALGWVSERLTELEHGAAQVNAQWVPPQAEGLAADEIFSHGQPNLIVVGTDSLFIYALTRQPARDGDTWGCVLLDLPATDQVARDGGTGLEAGVAAAQLPAQLDWWHPLRELWRLAASLERRAYAALEQVAQREAMFHQAHTPKRLEYHLTQWEKETQRADQAVAAYDTLYAVARPVNELFTMFEGLSGRLRDPQTMIPQLQALGQQLAALGGEANRELGTTLRGQAEALCAYLPRLVQALAPWRERWGEEAFATLGRVWQAEEAVRRGHLGVRERGEVEACWNHNVDAASALLGAELFTAWESLLAILGRHWRTSSAVECVNGLLRPHLDAHRSTHQNGLELLRFLHNVHPFQRGKRAGTSPAQRGGLEVPADPWALLGLSPSQFAEKNRAARKN